MTTKALAPPQDPQPTYDGTAGRFIRRSALTLKTLAAETASYTTDTGIWVEALTVSLNLHLTASSSPTTLDVVVQASGDGTNWFTVGTFAQLGAVATGDKYLECPGGKYMRYTSTIAGTSYTYSIIGTYRW